MYTSFPLSFVADQPINILASFTSGAGSISAAVALDSGEKKEFAQLNDATLSHPGLPVGLHVLEVRYNGHPVIYQHVQVTPSAFPAAANDSAQSLSIYFENNVLLSINAGATGPKGDKGDKGDQGEKGEKGDQGPAGDLNIDSGSLFGYVMRTARGITDWEKSIYYNYGEPDIDTVAAWIVSPFSMYSHEGSDMVTAGVRLDQVQSLTPARLAVFGVHTGGAGVNLTAPVTDGKLLGISRPWQREVGGYAFYWESGLASEWDLVKYDCLCCALIGVEDDATPAAIAAALQQGISYGLAGLPLPPGVSCRMGCLKAPNAAYIKPTGQPIDDHAPAFSLCSFYQ